MSFGFIVTYSALMGLLFLFIASPLYGLQLIILARSSIGPLREYYISIGPLHINGLALIGMLVIVLGIASPILRKNYRATLFFKIYLVAVIWFGATSFFLASPVAGFVSALRMLAPLMLFVIVTREIRSHDLLKRMLKIIAFSSVVPILYGFYQSFMGLGIQKVGDIKRVNSLFLLPNPYAFYLSIVAVVILLLLYMEKKRRDRFIYLALLATAFTSLLLSGTRTALAGLIFAFGMFFFLNKRFLPLLFGIFFGLVAVATLPQVTERIMEPLDAFITDKGIDVEKGMDIKRPHWEWNTLQGRIYLWSIAWKSIKEKPLVGHGGGAHKVIIGNEVHNDYLRLLMDYGFIGFTLYLSAFMVLVVGTYKNWRKADTPFDKYLQSGTLSAICMMMVFMIADNVVVDNTFLWYLFTLIGLSQNARLNKNESNTVKVNRFVR